VAGWSSVGWADIRAVGGTYNQWHMDLAARPPTPADLTARSQVVTYGLVFDRTGDGVADIIVGAANDPSRPGELRVWYTDLATGETIETGTRYGFPVEFSHPNFPLQGEPPEPPYMLFTFLRGMAGTPTHGLDGDSPFYAWTTVASGGEVISWDYAPDRAWVRVQPLGLDGGDLP
jgi:hypothetical protein